MDEAEELLYRYNPWWEADYSIDSILRHKYLTKLQALKEKRDIIIITGLRRVGKTTLMKQIINSFLNDKTTPTNIAYIPLDAYGLIDYSIHDLIRIYRKIHKIRINEKIYLFLDEVVAKKDYHIELKDFFDNNNVKIYASSSSASILKEGASLLTGRSRTVEILPLSFKEYLEFRKISIRKAEMYLLESYFVDYMKEGGMPEYILSRDPEDLTKVIDDIITKDIALKYNIDNKQSLKEFFKLLCERIGRRVSYARLSNTLDVSRDFVRRTLSYFEEAYLFYIMPACGKLTEQIKNPKKIYIADVGMRNITSGFRDKGAVYENLVYLKIKDSSPCYLLKNGLEIDFKFNKQIIEAKYGIEVGEKQKKVLEELKQDYTVRITKGYEFLLDE